MRVFAYHEAGTLGDAQHDGVRVYARRIQKSKRYCANGDWPQSGTLLVHRFSLLMAFQSSTVLHLITAISFFDPFCVLKAWIYKALL